MVVRGAGAALLLALLAVIASALWWPKGDVVGGIEPELSIRRLEGILPLVTVDVGGLYVGREELIDPKEVMPSWHRHDRREAAVVFEATRACPPRGLQGPLADVALVKAYVWAERTCRGGVTMAVVEEMLSSPPYMHPSGKSYAAMALARSGEDARAFAVRHWKKFHVLELAQSQSQGQSSGKTEDREALALAGLGSREWVALLRGDRFVRIHERLVFAERGPLGLGRLRFYERRDDDDAADSDAPFVLVSRTAACARPATSLLCWEPTAPRRNAAWQRAITGLAVAVIALSTLTLGIAFLRERRRGAMDRLHLLRTLTHELRTPAMALGLDIEPLRASYDQLPLHLQEPLLRLSGGIARLHRVLHHSARALELFERGPKTGALASPIVIESAHEMLKDLAAEWPEKGEGDNAKVTLECEGDDGAITTDAEWLAVALRNLVENACKHGTPPVVVRARLDHHALTLRVEDAGTTPDLSLRQATTAWTRLTTIKKDSGGLGLGLALVARVAEALGGTLAHEARPTAFVLTIPRKAKA